MSSISGYVTDLERLVSRSRMETFRPSNRDDLETAVNYLLNAALSESLLQSIAAVEVALRNSIHTAFTILVGTEQWFWAILKNDDLRIINVKWTKLALSLKAPPPAGKVIADLTFGFWPYLFERRYNNLWLADGEAMLRAVFPLLPMSGPPHHKIGRAEIYERLALFRDLRNRAMHHEPIVFGIARPDFGIPPPVVRLDEAHSQMIAMLNWIDPVCALSLAFVDRFPDVFKHEEDRIRVKLQAHFNMP